jgi:hypothetical protein
MVEVSPKLDRDSAMLPACLKRNAEVMHDNLAVSDWLLSSLKTLLPNMGPAKDKHGARESLEKMKCSLAKNWRFQMEKTIRSNLILVLISITYIHIHTYSYIYIYMLHILYIYMSMYILYISYYIYYISYIFYISYIYVNFLHMVGTPTKHVRSGTWASASEARQHPWENR